MLAPPKQKGVYPFFTFCDLSLRDVIDDSAIGQVDISTVGRGSQGRNMVESRPETDYMDEDFLVVECRTNVSDMTPSLPTPVFSQTRSCMEGGTNDDKTGNSVVVNGCTVRCSATDEGSKT